MHQGYINASKVLVLFLTLSGCSSDVGKSKYWDTIELSDEMYVEVHKAVTNGAYGSDLLEEYLTDSTNFRVRIGLMDEYNESYHYKFIGSDSILIEKTRKDDTSTAYKVIQSNTYSIKELQKIKNVPDGNVISIETK